MRVSALFFICYKSIDLLFTFCYTINERSDTMKMTVKETAKHYKVSIITIRNWIKDGLKYSKKKEIGKRTYYLIDPKDVESYHKSKEVR